MWRVVSWHRFVKTCVMVNNINSRVCCGKVGPHHCRKACRLYILRATLLKRALLVVSHLDVNHVANLASVRSDRECHSNGVSFNLVAICPYYYYSVIEEPSNRGFLHIFRLARYCTVAQLNIMNVQRSFEVCLRGI